MAENSKVVINLGTGLEDAERRLAGATPLWEWIGESATVFSY